MRKFAWAVFSFAAAILLRHYVLPDLLWVWLVIPLAAVGLCGCMFRGKVRSGILLVCVFSILGIFRYDLQVKEKIGPAESLQGTDYTITAYVAEFPVISEDYSKLTVYLRTDELPQVKTILYDYDNDVEALKPGDQIRTTVKFSSATALYGEETDTYISKGIYLRGTIVDDIERSEPRWGKLLFFPLYLARNIQNTLDLYTSEGAAVFLKALLTGEKTPLYEQPRIHHILQDAGLSHVIAVSGMHISILIGMIAVLFGNRTGWLMSIFFIGIFAFMTGMSPSVLRAVFMQVLYLLAPILRREPDGITSVCFALFILLMVNPFAIASVSLQLSFSSILGIHLITQRAINWFSIKGDKLHGPIRKLYSVITLSLSTTLGASVFTVPICAIHFGSISVLAPIANLLILWVIPACFVLGFGVCAVSLVSTHLAAALGAILSLVVEFIYSAAELIAAVPFSSVSLPINLMLIWVGCVYASIGITYLLNRNKPFKPLVPMCVAVFLLAGLLSGMRLYYRSGTTVAAIDVGQGQCIAVLNGENTILIDCGGTYDSGDTVANWLSERGRSDVDCMVLTHLDEDHTNGIPDLISQIPIKEIMYCSLNMTEYEIFREIKRYTEENGTTLTIVNSTKNDSVGDIKLQIYVPIEPKGNNGLMALVSVDEFDILVTGDADIATEKEMMRRFNLPDGECLVSGHHGSKYSTSEELIKKFSPEFSFISCGYNSYGHPSREVLDRLEKRNVVIYRTDILGSVEVKVR